MSKDKGGHKVIPVTMGGREKFAAVPTEPETDEKVGIYNSRRGARNGRRPRHQVPFYVVMAQLEQVEAQG